MTGIRQFIRHPLTVMAATLIVLPLAMHAAGSTLSLASQVVIYCLYGLGFNVLLGYTGLVSFGQSAFFGFAGYITALVALHLVQDIWLGLFLGTVLTGFLGLLVGMIILRRQGIYFALLTLAVSQLFFEIAYRWTSVTGGENGLQGVSQGPIANPWMLYAFCAVVTWIVAWMLWRVAHSPFGRVLQLIRDSEKRAMALGYETTRYKLMAFTLSAFVCGFAGSLLTYVIEGVYANNMNWEHAGDPVMMTLFGGMHYFLGPLWGAILYINLSDQLSSYTEHWWLIFGALLMAVILLSPEGLSGIWSRLFKGRVVWGLTDATVPEPPEARQDDVELVQQGYDENQNVLVLEDICKNFGSLGVARNVSLELKQGEIHSLIGPNGAGKTTLFNMISGFILRDSGKVLLDDIDIGELSVDRRANLGIGRSFQIVTLPGDSTVFESVRVAVQAKSRTKRSLWRDAYGEEGVISQTWAVLEKVGLQEKASAQVASLPHGEKRLLDIGIALAQSPRVLLLDEPLAGLADRERERISDLIVSLRGQVTTLVVEHDIDRVRAFSDTMTVLHYGEVIADGRPEEVMQNRRVLDAYMGESVERAAAEAHVPAAAAKQQSGEVQLKLDGVVAGYGGGSVLDGLELTVKRGEAVALLGRNGVGKTTTLHTVMGLVRASKGQITFDGADITTWSPDRIARTGLAIVPQGRRIFPNLTVSQNLDVASRRGGWAVEDVYRVFPKLKELHSAQGDRLSGGEQQMLAIARALMAPAKLILLDEPFEGLAPSVVADVQHAVEEILSHASVLLVEQRATLALNMTQRAYVMVNGRIAHEAASQTLLEDEGTLEEFLGV